jgi:hypothetical protein
MREIKAEIVKMRQWCEDNYSNGADTMVECWADEDYERLFAHDDYTGLTPTTEDAWRTLKDVAEVYAERQADAAYYRENN